MTDHDSHKTIKLLDDFAEAWNKHDADRILSMMTSDCVMQMPSGTGVNGTTFTGHDQIRVGINQVFSAIPDVAFNNPKHFITDDRGITEWILTGTGPAGPIEAAGCDVFTFRDGKIALKNSYRKYRPAS
jgi:uncharacterized protein (TIGR02246 family)